MEECIENRRFSKLGGRGRTVCLCEIPSPAANDNYSMQEDLFQLGIKALITNKEGKVLLLMVNKKELKKYDGEAYWDIPGGRIHRGVSAEETLKREVLEETGLTKIESIKPFAMVLSNIRIPMGETDTGLILSVYTCVVDESEQIRLSSEHIEYGWFVPREASELLKIKYPKEFTSKLENGF